MNAARIRPFISVMTVVVFIHGLLGFSISKDLGAAFRPARFLMRRARVT